jgi:hypothetical protein
MTTTATLAQTVQAANAAEEAARKATQAAEQARQRAEAARLAAEEERQQANIRYLTKLESEHGPARTEALNQQVAARAALEAAVRDGGDVFGTYAQWVEACVGVWEVDAALSGQRDYLGRPARPATMPSFDFAIDVAGIVNHLSLEAQDRAAARIADRRAAFLDGKEAK